MLALCIPLQVLASEETEKPVSVASFLYGDKNKDPSQEEALQQKVKDNEEENKGGNQYRTEEEKQAAAEIAAAAEQQRKDIQKTMEADPAAVDPNGTESSNNPFVDGVTNSNAIRGFVGGTRNSEAIALRISLAKLDNQGFAIYGNKEALDAAIQDYGRKYYVACEEGAYYYSPGGWACSTTNRGKTMKKAPEGSITHDILYGLFHGEPNAYVGTRSSGEDVIYEINLDETSMDAFMLEMSSIDAYNNSLYQEWKSGSSAYPIIAAVEVMGITVNGFRTTDANNNAWVSVADCAYEIGGTTSYEAYLKLDMSTLSMPIKAEGGTAGNASASDIAMSMVTPMVQWIKGSNIDAHDWWPFFYTKHMFNTWWPNGVLSDSTLPPTEKGRQTSSWSMWAYNARQTKSSPAAPIVGCTMFTLRPGAGGQPSGVFDWHIDSEGLPLNASGHAEDKAVDDTGGSAYKQCEPIPQHSITEVLECYGMRSTQIFKKD